MHSDDLAIPVGETESDHRSRWGNSLAVGVAVCFLMVGIVFRGLAAGDYLWLDEQHTAWVAKASLAEVTGRAIDGNQTPLFFYACWASLKAGGESAVSLRLPSLLCGLILLSAVPVWVYRRTASAASLLVVSAWLLFDYDAVFYASEARPYAMVQLLGVLQAAAFWYWIEALWFVERSEDANAPSCVSRWGIATAVLAALIFYTHPTGMLLMFAEIIFVLGLMVFARRQSGVPWRALLWVAGLCAVLVLPGVLMLSMAWQRRDNWTSVSDAERVLMTVAVQAAMMIVIPLVAAAVARLLPRHPRRRLGQGQSWSMLVFVGLWAIIPSAMICGLDALGWVSLAIGRYAIVGSVAFTVFAALVIGGLRNGWLRWTVTLGIVGLLAWFSAVPWQLRDGGFRNENWDAVVQAINGEDERLPVFLLANLIEDNAAETDLSDRFQDYLGFPIKGIPGLINPQRIVPRPTQGKILSLDNIESIVDHRGGFVVVRDAEKYREPIRLELHTVLQNHAVTKSAQLLVAPVDRPRPNNLHLFWIRLDDAQ